MGTKDFDAVWAVYLRLRRDEGADAAYEWLRVYWLLEETRQQEKVKHEHKRTD